VQAEILSIGDELTSGQRLDTNSQWLSRQLGNLGVPVLYHTTVADDMEAIATAFRQAAGRVQLVITTGGLGPTADDLTRQALAAAAGRPLVLDDAVLAHIEQLFSRRGRPMPKQNRVQAFFPQGASVVENPHGSAPGIDLRIDSGEATCRIFALPGVPAEMRQMWAQTLSPEIEKMLGPDRQVIRHRQLRCFGVGESDLEQMLPDLVRRGRDPSVGITVSRATITLRITARGKDDAACAIAIEPVAQMIRQSVGELVFGEGEDELQHAVVRLLRERGQTLGVCEMATAGLIAGWLSEADDEQQVFRGGVTGPSGDALTRLLGIRDEAADLDPPSDEFARLAAESIRRLGGADVGLCVTALPLTEKTPSGGREHVVALCTAAGTIAVRQAYGGHPDILLPRCAKQSLDVLRRIIVGLPAQPT